MENIKLYEECLALSLEKYGDFDNLSLAQYLLYSYHLKKVGLNNTITYRIDSSFPSKANNLIRVICSHLSDYILEDNDYSLYSMIGQLQLLSYKISDEKNSPEVLESCLKTLFNISLTFFEMANAHNDDLWRIDDNYINHCIYTLGR